MNNNEFKENLTMACSEKDPLIDPSCHFVIKNAFWIVRTFGESHYKPFKDCSKNCLCRSGGKNLKKACKSFAIIFLCGMKVGCMVIM